MITDIRLQGFRSYSDASFEFGEGVNIIVGPNASGKTNLLESILVIARGSSYRAKDAELITFDTPWARLDSNSVDHERTVKLERMPLTTKKSFIIDGKLFQRLSLQKSLPVTIFEPNHLQLLGGVPDLRRVYMDELLEQTIPGYTTLRQHYRRTLSQRNALLKRGYDYAAPQLFAWNIRLSQLGGQIAGHRNQLLNGFNLMAHEIYAGLSHTEAEVSLEYVSNFEVNNYESAMLHKLEASVYTDCERGFTTSGPHRDDLRVMLNSHNALTSASRGETRTLLLLLKILEAQLLERVRGVKPLLLLDDVFSELDGARRQALTHYLRDYQTFITTTDADVVIQHFMNDCTIIPLG
jgi:DNA replication and repair protein RecF